MNKSYFFLSIFVFLNSHALLEVSSRRTADGVHRQTGYWSEWGEFGKCDADCGNGYSFRFRECSTGNTNDCPGYFYDHVECFIESCLKERKIWSSWVQSSCDQPCGVGARYKVRMCQEGNSKSSDENDTCVGESFGAELCYNKRCPLYKGGECYDVNNPNGYRGSVNQTGDGRNCFSWDHLYSIFRPSKYPNSGLVLNYCRNPNYLSGPWCFSNKRRTKISFCSVDVCPTNIEVFWNSWSEWSTCSSSCGEGNRFRVRSCNGGVITQGGCHGAVMDKQKCYSPAACTESSERALDCAKVERSNEYRGTGNVTNTGLTCQRWNSQTPHLHDYHPYLYPNQDLRENFCRNPDGDRWPWCFTTNLDQQWDYCDIPECEEEAVTEALPGCYDLDRASEYRGSTSITTSGYSCQYWDSNSPNQHKYKSYLYPGKGLGHHNYCRAPEDDTRPWCITTRPNYIWEFCNVKVCGESTTQAPSNNSAEEICGRPEVPIKSENMTTAEDQRIVGGVYATRGSIPWQVALLTSHHRLICGASIINKDWIMTAAHCIAQGSGPSSYVGFAGRYTRAGQDKEEVEFQFQKIIIHEFYDDSDLSNDIALLKLNHSLVFTPFIKPVCLPPPSSVDSFEVGEHVLATGWGKTKASFFLYPVALHQVYVPLVLREECEESYGHLHPGMICAGYMENGGKDACGGDSGGPLVRLATYEQIGIISWGVGCAQAEKPGVYTYVPFYVNWIRDNMNLY